MKFEQVSVEIACNNLFGQDFILVLYGLKHYTLENFPYPNTQYRIRTNYSHAMEEDLSEYLGEIQTFLTQGTILTYEL